MDADEIAWLNDYHARVRKTLSPWVGPPTRRWLAKATRRLAAARERGGDKRRKAGSARIPRLGPVEPPSHATGNGPEAAIPLRFSLCRNAQRAAIRKGWRTVKSTRSCLSNWSCERVECATERSFVARRLLGQRQSGAFDSAPKTQPKPWQSPV